MNQKMADNPNCEFRTRRAAQQRMYPVIEKVAHNDWVQNVEGLEQVGSIGWADLRCLWAHYDTPPHDEQMDPWGCH